MLKMSLEPKPIRPRRVNSDKIANDNEASGWSHLTFTKQALIERRINDLKWQANFAKIHLNRWKKLEDYQYLALQGLLDKAQSELNGLLG